MKTNRCRASPTPRHETGDYSGALKRNRHCELETALQAVLCLVMTRLPRQKIWPVPEVVVAHNNKVIFAAKHHTMDGMQQECG